MSSAGTDYERLRDALYELRGNSDIRFGWESDRVAAEAEAIFEALLGELVAVREECDAAIGDAAMWQDVAEEARAERDGFREERDALLEAIEDWRKVGDEADERARQAIAWAYTHKVKPAEAALVAVREERDAAQREADWQMGAKLEAQLALQAIVKGVALDFSALPDGWKAALAVVLARIEEIVDAANDDAAKAEAAERERDTLREALRQASDMCARPRGVCFDAALSTVDTPQGDDLGGTAGAVPGSGEGQA